MEKKRPLIGILALNPHAGEGGLIGEEEKKIILPVVEDLKAENLNLHGPLSGDTCFLKTTEKIMMECFVCFMIRGYLLSKPLIFLILSM